jgi:gluconolactonase
MKTFLVGVAAWVAVAGVGTCFGTNAFAQQLAPQKGPEKGAPATQPAATPELPGMPGAVKPDPFERTTPFEAAAPVVVEKGYRFTEGPCWIPGTGAGPGYFVFCDVPTARVYRWEVDVGTAVAPVLMHERSGRALGTAVAPSGLLYHCESEGRRVTAFEIKDGKPQEAIELAAKFEGKRLNCPNDLVVAKDGTVYFTDPTFFTPQKELELSFSGVYALRTDGTLTALHRDIKLPNGLALSPDEKTLYVNDFGNGQIMMLDLTAAPVAAPAKPGEEAAPAQLPARVLVSLVKLSKDHDIQGRGRADGLRVLPNGTILSTGPGAIYAISPDGKILGMLPIEGASNLAVGGADGRTLLITAGGQVMAARLKDRK